MELSFEALFPLPKRLVRPAVGLDISDQSIKLVELEIVKGKIRLRQYNELPVPPGIITGGQIKKPDELGTILSGIRKRYGIYLANVSLPEEQTYVTKVRVPLVSGGNVREQIELHLDEYVPLSPEETEFDFEIMKSAKTPRDSVDTAVVAMPKVTVEGYLSAFQAAGIQPFSFELEAQAVARSLIDSHDEGTIMTVDFGKDRTGVAIVSGGHVLFGATLPFGGRYNTKIVMELEHRDEKAAEELKRSSGLARRSGHEELYSMLLSHISVLRDEMNKYLLYWHTHKDEKGDDHTKVEKVLLCGGESNLLGLPEYLSATLDIPVMIGNPWVNAFSLDEYIPALDQPNSLRFATAIGLALRSLV